MIRVSTSGKEMGRLILLMDLFIWNRYSGGVYAPGAAFAKTTLIERLTRRGITFETRWKIKFENDMEEANIYPEFGS